jgi:hypothetical protein
MGVFLPGQCSAIASGKAEIAAIAASNHAGASHVSANSVFGVVIAIAHNVRDFGLLR